MGWKTRCTHDRVVWTPKFGGSLMLMSGDVECCSYEEGEYKDQEKGRRAAENATGELRVFSEADRPSTPTTEEP